MNRVAIIAASASSLDVVLGIVHCGFWASLCIINILSETLKCSSHDYNEHMGQAEFRFIALHKIYKKGQGYSADVFSGAEGLLLLMNTKFALWVCFIPRVSAGVQVSWHPKIQ